MRKQRKFFAFKVNSSAVRSKCKRAQNKYRYRYRYGYISTFISCASSITKPAEDVLISSARPRFGPRPSLSPDPVAYREPAADPRNRHGRQKTIELMTWLWTVGISRFGSGSRWGLGLVGALLFIRLCVGSFNRLPQVSGAALLSYGTGHRAQGGETYALKVLLNYAKLLNFNNKTDRTELSSGSTRWNYKFSLKFRMELNDMQNAWKWSRMCDSNSGFSLCLHFFSWTTLAAIAPHSAAIPAWRRRAARRLMGPSNWSLMLPFISLVSTRLGLFVLLVSPAAAAD